MAREHSQPYDHPGWNLPLRSTVVLRVATKSSRGASWGHREMGHAHAAVARRGHYRAASRTRIGPGVQSNGNARQLSADAFGSNLSIDAGASAVRHAPDSRGECEQVHAMGALYGAGRRSEAACSRRRHSVSSDVMQSLSWA